MRNSDPLVWGLTGDTSLDDDGPTRLCEKIWATVNGKVFSAVIVTLVFVEGLVIFSELLIDFEVVQDPQWKTSLNCSANVSGLVFSSAGANSPKLRMAKDILSYISIVILIIFVFEVGFRLVSGRARYLIQGMEICDAIVVLVAFGLDIAFLTTPSKKGAGKEAAVLIILLRLWRIKRILQSVIDNTRLEMGHFLSICEREKIQAEHKVDILILKVEDLEHEVAYLKEKLKKTEKESLYAKRQRKKDGYSSTQHKHPTITIGVETSPARHPCTGTQTAIVICEQHIPEEKVTKEQVMDMRTFADVTSTRIIADALCMVTGNPNQFLRSPTTGGSTVKDGTTSHCRIAGDFESGYISNVSGITWDKAASRIPTLGTRTTLKCPESSPESGYGSSSSARNPAASSVSPLDTGTETASTSTGSSKHTDTVFLFPDPTGQRREVELGVEMDILEEISEIERVKHIEFDPNKQDQDIPMTSL
ncbi:transmembrane protein 266-like [Limulus polyphemus]|uniref:Transmembrane protein 266-like n=1 Tax=Limulus polyphemus TaxID=6850 RepID=A0ABM1SRW4_LIMPO|nr:transmembrane protein 266-like [Limulus polyphemus]